MKTFKLLTLLTLFISFSSCSDDNIDGPVILDLESSTVSNLHAPQEGGIDQNTGEPLPISGEFTKFNFSTGETTTSATDWDIAFRGLSIVLNGGVSNGLIDEPERTGNAAAYLTTGTMLSITNVDTSLLEQDSSTGFVLNDWYTYAGPPTHLIAPVPGRILVIRTRDNKYAKVEILSYYQDAPENPNAFNDAERYYTFNYVYQPNEGELLFQWQCY